MLMEYSASQSEAFSELDLDFMTQALHQARLADACGEVPVGAVLVHEGQVIARGFNQPISSHDPSAHAEALVVRSACLRLQNYRLPKDCTLYVTLEPCMMCMGLLNHARLGRLVFGALEPRTGAVVSQYDYVEKGYYNHRMQVQSGLLAEESAALLRAFFKARRG